MDEYEDECARGAIFEAVDCITAEALIEWYNCSMLGMEDAKRLIDLHEKGNFWHSECANSKCPNKGDKILVGYPDDWDHFQGVLQSDRCGELCEDCAAEYRYLKQFADD